MKSDLFKESIKMIYAEMLKHGTEKRFEKLTYVINKCLNGHPVEDGVYIVNLQKGKQTRT